MDWFFVIGTLLVLWAVSAGIIAVAGEGFVTRCMWCGKHFTGSRRQGLVWFENHDCELGDV